MIMIDDEQRRDDDNKRSDTDNPMLLGEDAAEYLAMTDVDRIERENDDKA